MKRTHAIKSTLFAAAVATLSQSACSEDAEPVRAEEARKPIPATLFGQNFEHTRAMVTGGLSAELVANRKFAGKPYANGVARSWRATNGGRTVYDLLEGGFTRHNGGGAMPRRNERGSQKITCLETNDWGGIAQGGLPLRKGKHYIVTVHARGCFAEDRVRWRLRLRAPNVAPERAVLAECLATTAGTDWKTVTFECASTQDRDVSLEIALAGVASGVVGAASVLPTDHFHGMRRDVIAALKEIGTSIVRWPGGNFAGDYRWRDGLLPRDERAPLQSFMESETQAYTGGYDANDIGTEEILALCAELKAEPFFTLNANWDSPEESAEWLRFCKGRVKRWSLGNEFGYRHMEGPYTPEGYARMAKDHAAALKSVDPAAVLTTSGLYPQPATVDAWLQGSAIPLKGFSTSVSAHGYVRPDVYDYSSSTRIQQSLDAMCAKTEDLFDDLRSLAAKLPPNFTIAFDEWNFWYSWFREDGGVQGAWAMYALHRLLGSWQDLKLDCACYFQAVNEGAVKVTARGVRLTSVGEALRLAKGHIGGVPTSEFKLPPTAFATRRADGSHYVTAFNPSVTEPLELTFPASPRLSGERLEVADACPGTRYRKCTLRTSGRLTLPPLSIIGVSATSFIGKDTDAVPLCARTEPVIDARLPAGNILVERCEGKTVFVHQDLRDTDQDWFYWKFRVTGAEGQTLKFRFTKSAAVGSRGPAVSTDRGKTWTWGDDLQPAKRREAKTNDHPDWQAFDWTFGPKDAEVWFCQTIPYDPADWDAFLARHAAEKGTLFETGALCRSRKGHDVPYARFGRLDGKARERIFLSSRHHCGEATATLVLEGILDQVFAQDALGRWLRENAEIRVVPFADLDGVLAGDQGKRRKPHDHARDYSDEKPVLYPEVRAIMKLLREWQPTVVNDFHCPWLRGSWFEENNSNEFIYQVGLPGQEVAARQTAFGKALEQVQTAGCGYRQTDDYWFGRGWNAGANYTQGMTLVQWALGVFKEAKFISSWEIPFANARAKTLRAADFRALGRDFAAAYRAYLATRPFTKPRLK